MLTRWRSLLWISTFAVTVTVVHVGGQGIAGELMLTGPNSNVAQKAKISGNNLMLLGQNGKWIPAPDATYVTRDGKKIIVQGGAIASGVLPHFDTTGGVHQRKKDAADPKEGTSGGALRRALDDGSKNK